MNFKKLIRKRTIIWGATSVFLAATLITANVLMRNRFSDLLDGVFGGKRAITKVSDETIDFGQVYTTKKDAFNHANKVVEDICEEGMILLKNENNALPLKNKAKVTVFGKNSVSLVYGGSGSAEPGKDEKNPLRRTVQESLEDAGFECNQKIVDFYKSKDSGSGRSSNPDISTNETVQTSATLETGETPISSYPSDVINSYGDYGDAAIVVFSRIAGENWDLPRTASDDSSRHYLELDNNERALLKHIVDSGKFQHIIVLLNGSNYIDLSFLRDNSVVDSSKIDACINIGSPGGSGIMALGRILSGKVNPSGHTVDLVYTNYKSDPTWQNFGGNFQDNGDSYLPGLASEYFFVDYEENIYMGYRYYETRYAEMAKTDPSAAEAWYNEHVMYPFGYGLSYTTFSEEITNKSDLASALKADEKFTIKVKVTNTGSAKGKQVVQVYAEAPYEAGKIEKSSKVLAGFAKTKELDKNESDEVEIEINPYYFASFDNLDANGDGFKGYTLDAGDYVFHVATDSHHDVDTFTKNLATTAKIENDPETGTKVVPLFDDVTKGTKGSLEQNPVELTYLSRNNWDGTFPTTPTDDDRKINGTILKQLQAYESHNNESYDDKEMPKMGVIGDKLIRFKELARLEYNDPKWEAFLDQLDFQDLLDIVNKGCYKTTEIEKTVNGEKVVLVPKTISADGPTGMVAFLGAPEVYGCCYYCSECLVAQTYNVELATAEAEAIGEECLIGNEKGDGLAYPGWYAPGVNLHRSPFSGRNTEYYSEDPFLCGRMAATVIKGVQSKGVYANVKHFALNDQETHRSANGIATWANEQAMRELYLRPFEMAVKEGKSKGLMTSFNRIGTTWAGGDYRLCTTVLRKEWGFVGSVICDFHTGAYMDSKQMLYAGGDLNLCGDENLWLDGKGDNDVSISNKKDVILLRNSVHNILYCVATSNIMKAEVIGYKNAPWVNVLNGVTIGVSVGLVGWGAWAIASALLKKEETVAAAATASEATGETKAE